MDDQRPKLIPPLVQSDAALELVRERPRVRREIEHPHCDEHFLFTPHCAACLEAERTQAATAKATPVEKKQEQPRIKLQPGSRSFGFTDNIPYSLIHEPTIVERLARIAASEAAYGTTESPITDTLLDI